MVRLLDQWLLMVVEILGHVSGHVFCCVIWV